MSSLENLISQYTVSSERFFTQNAANIFLEHLEQEQSVSDILNYKPLAVLDGLNDSKRDFKRESDRFGNAIAEYNKG